MTLRLFTLALVHHTVFAGQCTEEMASEWIGNTAFALQIKDCAVHHLGQGPAVASCLNTAYPSLSSGCAACFGETVDCGRINCMVPCAADSFSSECLACTRSAGCDDQLVACTGFSSGPPVPTSGPTGSADATTLTTKASSIISTTTVFAIAAAFYL
jgi:hypothetical protein